MMYDPPFDFMAPTGTHVEGLDMCQASLPVNLEIDPSLLAYTPILKDDTNNNCPGLSNTIITEPPSLSLFPTSPPTDASSTFLLNIVVLMVGIVAIALM
jgi:hypothetical protein